MTKIWGFFKKFKEKWNERWTLFLCKKNWNLRMFFFFLMHFPLHLKIQTQSNLLSSGSLTNWPPQLPQSEDRSWKLNVDLFLQLGHNFNHQPLPHGVKLAGQREGKHSQDWPHTLHCETSTWWWRLLSRCQVPTTVLHLRTDHFKRLWVEHKTGGRSDTWRDHVIPELEWSSFQQDRKIT